MIFESFLRNIKKNTAKKRKSNIYPYFRSDLIKHKNKKQKNVRIKNEKYCFYPYKT